MDPIANIVIPALTLCAMTVVGLELSIEDFAELLRRPRKLLLATLAQVVVLPAIAFGVIALVDPPLHHTLGLIVIAGCPGGAFSNFFTALARGEAALSVALTTACTLVAVINLPLVVALGFALFIGPAEAIRPPVLMMVGQLILLLGLPLFVGMTLRKWRRELFARLLPRLRRIVLVGISGLVAWLLFDHAGRMAEELGAAVLVASLFLVPSMLLGEGVGRWLRLDSGERFAYVVELGFRNFGLATVVAITQLRQEGFLAFATIFFVTAILYALAAVALFRVRAA